jgi:spore coat polysaccharide biosynthesis protein SpsF
MNEQEALWAGNFGDEYTKRMDGDAWIKSNIDFFSNALIKAKGINSILELGCNRGLNLAALEYLDQSTVKSGIDINKDALTKLISMFDDLKLDRPFIHCSSIDKYETLNTYDLVFTKGVLIHINPNQLESVYEKMYNLSNKYILIAEYYNPMPAEVIYRGMEGKLFKRDFAGEMMDKYKLKLVDYRFVYHRGEHPQDDITAFLLEKV